MSILPIVLNFSGNDTAGLAGMAMDVRTQTAMGVHSASVVTANTAQNNQQVISINSVEHSVFDDQIKAITDLPVIAVKVGLVASLGQCKKISQFVAQEKLPLVVDPVLGSSSGADFLENDYIKCYQENFYPHLTLLTPNIPEAQRLSGVSIQSKDDIIAAAKKLLDSGVNAVLIKGGHFDCEEKNSDAHIVQGSNIVQGSSIIQDCNIVQDYFTDGIRSFWLSSERVLTSNIRGTGCALSSAIASSLALGYSLYDSVVIGKMAISQGLRQSYSIDSNSDNINYGPINITHFPDQQMDLPVLTQTAIHSTHIDPFLECNQPVLGLYPVVDRADWISKLAPAGISTIQLRVKDLSGDDLEKEIEQAVSLANQYGCRLFINDYWKLAIKYQAYGVHLGQEDLDDADVQKIKIAGLRLGTSTHCHYEVARAHTYRPSYIACGPVYHTTTKDMPWVPHGIEGLSYWRKVLNYPLVAIGGINRERFNGIAATGVDSVAMITAITLAENPEDTAKEFVQMYQDTVRKKELEKPAETNLVDERQAI